MGRDLALVAMEHQNKYAKYKSITHLLGKECFPESQFRFNSHRGSCSNKPFEGGPVGCLNTVYSKFRTISCVRQKTFACFSSADRGTAVSQVGNSYAYVFMFFPCIELAHFFVLWHLQTWWFSVRCRTLDRFLLDTSNCCTCFDHLPDINGVDA